MKKKNVKNKKTKKENVKNKKKKLLPIILISIVLTIALAAGIFLYIRYKQLDGRECMTCPYVYDLKTGDIDILDKSLSGYNATVELGTGISSVKIDGSVTLLYDCNVNYCFDTSYGGDLCSWNYPSTGRITYNFDESYSEIKTFSVEPVHSPTSIFMYRNSITCDFSVDSVSGKIMIYGEKID